MTTECKVGDKFVVVKEHSNFKLGEIVTLKFLDNDNCHAYTQNDGQDYWFAFDDKLEPYLEEPSYSKDIYISEEVTYLAEGEPFAPSVEYSGSGVEYYKVEIANPTTPGTLPYIAECNDIIEALQMDYAEGNILKAIWRQAAARQGKGKRGYDNGKYDIEKVIFFASRILETKFKEKE